MQTARQYSDQITKVYAGRNGIIGALTEDLIDTSMESEAAIAAPETFPHRTQPREAAGRAAHRLPVQLRERKQQLSSRHVGP